MERGVILKPIWLPVAVAVIGAPTAAAAIIGGPGLAVLVATAFLLAVVGLASRTRPREPIEVRPALDDTHRVLLALSAPLADAQAADQVAMAAAADGRPTQILVLAPAHSSLLDRWASEPGRAEAEARRKLEVTVESLQREHLDARTAIGDSDLIAAVEDALRKFPADELILATGSRREDPDGIEAALDLKRRLPIPVVRVVSAGALDEPEPVRGGQQLAFPPGNELLRRTRSEIKLLGQRSRRGAEGFLRARRP
ncbi:MAG: hypothetical protein JSS97_09665 [Actinobacteria bacterium]|nr:hypothetical protein [Actinomycetota bacterium]